GSVRKEESSCRFDGCVVRERRAAGGFGCRLAVRFARTGDAFLAMATHSHAADGMHTVWRVRGWE
ncbi:MAG: hypothetical protein NTZ28_00715, partial [Nitrospirae bacterium]|nr:hypothetical protein [Nitrospirota bacterium]